jgi:uncharacterized damage-inducible protein DinB
MTKPYFIQLADYNCWANNIVCNWLSQISDAQWQQPVVSSFGSIQATVLHVICAEHIWVGRMAQSANLDWLPASYKGSREQHIELWKNTAQRLKDFVTGIDENRLQLNFTFKRVSGEENTMPYYQTLAHVFNHSSYHRGQLVTMLRQVGFTGVQSTDLLNYYRL